MGLPVANFQSKFEVWALFVGGRAAVGPSQTMGGRQSKPFVQDLSMAPARGQPPLSRNQSFSPSKAPMSHRNSSVGKGKGKPKAMRPLKGAGAAEEIERLEQGKLDAEFEVAKAMRACKKMEELVREKDVYISTLEMQLQAIRDDNQSLTRRHTTKSKGAFEAVSNAVQQEAVSTAVFMTEVRSMEVEMYGEGSWMPTLSGSTSGDVAALMSHRGAISSRDDSALTDRERLAKRQGRGGPGGMLGKIKQLEREVDTMRKMLSMKRQNDRDKTYKQLVSTDSFKPLSLGVPLNQAAPTDGGASSSTDPVGMPVGAAAPTLNRTSTAWFTSTANLQLEDDDDGLSPRLEDGPIAPIAPIAPAPAPVSAPKGLRKPKLPSLGRQKSKEGRSPSRKSRSSSGSASGGEDEEAPVVQEAAQFFTAPVQEVRQEI